MDLDKIMMRFYLVVAKGLRHKHYAHTVEKHKDYMALVGGVGLDEKLKQYVRREDKKLFDQRVALTNHIVTAVSKNLLDPFYKVPRSNSGRRVLNYKGNAREGKLEEVENMLSTFWGDDESWDDYMATRFTELNSTDPNAFVVFEFKDFDATREMVSPYPYEVSSEMAIDYKRTNQTLSYLIARDAHRYRVRSVTDNPAINGATASALPDTKNGFKSGNKYTLYTKNQTFQLLQVHETEENGLSALSEGKPTALGADRRTFIKLGKNYYQYLEFLPHNCEQVPAVQVGYYRDIATHGQSYVNPIHPAIPYLDKTIKVNSELDLVATLLAFPQMIMYGEPCPDTSCHKGYYEDNTLCNTCGGTGVKANAPSSQDAVVIRMPESKEQMIPLTELIKYIAPPVETVKWQEDYIQKLTFNAKRIMFNSDVFDRKQIADTATGKTIDMQNVYDTLHPFAVKFGKTWRAGVVIMAKLADRAEDLVASYTFGKDFKLKTLDSLIFDLSTASNIGSPALVRHLNYDIAQIIFAEKPLELQRYKLKEMYNPFAGKSEKEIIVLLASALVSRKDKVLHANYGRIFDELELEHAKKNGGDFYQLKRTAQREAIYNKVAEIIAELDAETPPPALDLGE